MSKKPTELEPAQPKTITDMSDYELLVALNNQHNIIHQAQQQTALADQNIRSLMAETEKRKHG